MCRVQLLNLKRQLLHAERREEQRRLLSLPVELDRPEDLQVSRSQSASAAPRGHDGHRRQRPLFVVFGQGSGRGAPGSTGRRPTPL